MRSKKLIQFTDPLGPANRMKTSSISSIGSSVTFWKFLWGLDNYLVFYRPLFTKKNCKKPIKITQNFIEFFLKTGHEIKETHPNFPNRHVTKWGTNFEGFQKIWVKMCILQTGIFRFFLEKWRFLKYSGHVHMVLNS